MREGSVELLSLNSPLGLFVFITGSEPKQPASIIRN